MKIGTYIKTARLHKGLQQKELAVMVGITNTFLNDIEHHRRYPSDATLERLQSTLGLNMDFALSLMGKIPNDVAGHATVNQITKGLKAMRDERNK